VLVTVFANAGNAEPARELAAIIVARTSLVVKTLSIVKLCCVYFLMSAHAVKFIADRFYKASPPKEIYTKVMNC
jgi:hypothetical protein